MTPEDQIKRLTVPEFAARIKSRHPEYTDLDDADLTQRVLKKHPEYSSRVATETRPRNQAQAEADAARIGSELDKARDAYMSASGKTLNPPVDPSTAGGYRPLTASEQAAQKRGEPVIISEAGSVAPESLSRPRSTTAAPVSLDPVIQGRMEQIEREKRQRETQQKVEQARQVMQRRQGLTLSAGQRNEGAAFKPAFGRGQPYREIPKIDLSVGNVTQQLAPAPTTEMTFEQDRAARAAGRPLQGIGDLRRYEAQQAQEEARTKSAIRAGVLKEEAEREAAAASGSEAQLLAQRARQEGLNPPDIEGQVDERYQSYLRAMAPEMVQARQEFGALTAPQRTAAAPLARAAGGILKMAGGVTGLGGITPNDFSRWANARGAFAEESASLPPLNEKGEEIVKGLPEKAATAVADLGLTVAELVLLKKASRLPMGNLMALETALKTTDVPLAERSKQIAKAYAMGVVLDQHLGRVASAALFGAEPGIQNLAAYKEGRMTLEDALLQTGIQAGAGFILGGKGAKKLPKETVDYTLKSPYTPEPVKDVVANVVKYGKGLIRSEDGRAMSLYSDPKTGEVFGSEITAEQAKKYDPTVVTGEKRPVRNAKEIPADEYDFLARTLGVETKARPRVLQGEVERPEPIVEKPVSTSTPPAVEPKEVKPVSRPKETVSSTPEPKVSISPGIQENITETITKPEQAAILDQQPEMRTEKPSVSVAPMGKPQQIAPDQTPQVRTAKTQDIISASSVPAREPAEAPPAEIKTQPSATESQLTTEKEVTDELTDSSVRPEALIDSTQAPGQEAVPVKPVKELQPKVADIGPPSKEAKSAIPTKLTDWGSRLKTIAESKNLDDLQTLSDEMAGDKADPRVARLKSKIEKALQRAKEPDALLSRAFHGSPHAFDKFSTEKIGTGEGAQSYGHGLYFTDRQEIADYYRKTLGPGRGHQPNDIAARIHDSLPKDWTEERKNEAIVKELEKRKSDAGPDAKEFHATMDKAVESVRAGSHKGRVYAVELAPAEDEYLLWDKPLSEQSGKVKDAILSVLGSNAKYAEPTTSGEDIYRLAGGDPNGSTSSQRMASDTLHTLGIRGIKYLDQGSRHSDYEARWSEDHKHALVYRRDTEDLIKQLNSFAEADDWIDKNTAKSYNYVIFSDKDVDIVSQFARADYSTAIQQAFKDWKEHRAYIDNNGNYHVKVEGQSSGPIATWNKEAKKLFKKASELHAAAHAEPESGQSSMFARALGVLFVRESPKFAVESNRVSLNNRAALDLVNKAYETLYGEKGHFTGVFEKAPVSLAKEIRALKGGSDLADAIMRAAKEGDGKVVIFSTERTRKHELFHESSHQANRYLNDRHAHMATLQSGMDWMVMKAQLLRMGYPDNPSTLVEEAAAHIADGSYEKLGLTRDEAVEWMFNWFKSFETKNPSVNPRQFQEMSDEAVKARDEVYAARTEREQVVNETIPSLQAGWKEGDRASLARSPKATGREKQYIGAIDRQGVVVGTEDPSGEMDHDDIGQGQADRFGGYLFRYEPTSKTVYWTDDSPPELEFQHAVENWLDRRGQEVSAHGTYEDMVAESIARNILMARSEKGKIVKLYRGESVHNKGGGYYTTDKEWARQFTQSGRESEVSQKQLHDSLIYRAQELPKAYDEESFDKGMADAESKGFAAMWVDEGAGQPDSVYIIDRSVFDEPLFARSDDPWADLMELSEEFGRLANEPEPSEKETKQSRLAAGVEAKAIEAKLTAGFQGLPEYETVKVADQARMAAELLRNDPQEARRVALGQSIPPGNLLPESVFITVENDALTRGDVELLRELATVSTLSAEATGMGQRIRLLAERNPYSPVTAMKEVAKARETRAKKKMGPKFKERVVNEIKAEVRKAAPKARDWRGFLEEIKCR